MKRLFSLVLATLFIVGCTQFEEPDSGKLEESEDIERPQTRSGSVQLSNPYSLSQIQRAYDIVADLDGLSAAARKSSPCRKCGVSKILFNFTDIQVEPLKIENL